MSDRDPEQFVRLLARHDREVYRYVLTLLPHSADAEDVLQETAAALWDKFAAYDPEKPFFPWACRFAFYEVLKHRRRVGRSRLRFSEELIQSLADERLVEDDLLRARRSALDVCLTKLNESDRELLSRRYGSTASVIELARRRGHSTKRLYNALDRIRRNLMKCINHALAAEGVQ